MTTPTAPATQRPAPSGRDTYWDAVRGLCILGVIWTHTTTGIPYLDGPHAWNLDYWLAQRQLVNFPVAVFLFLAAYFVSPSKVADGAAWLRSRAVRLGVPFLLWSTAYTLLIATISGAWNPRLLVRDVVLGASVPHLYFIVVLLQLVLLTPLLLRALETRWRWALWAVTPIYLVWLYVRTLADGTPPSFSNTWLFGWFAFYLAGLWVRRHGAPSIRVPVAVGAVAVTVTAGVAESFLLVRSGGDIGFAAGQLTVGSVLGAFAVIALLLALHQRRERTGAAHDGERWFGLDGLGRDSYGIYYVHLLWFVLAWRVLEVPFDDGQVPVLPALQLVELAVVLALSLLAIAATRRLIGRRAATRFLGF
ncbi:acyltransferase family protein [Serinibacter arcticus]|uniref:acyltransferase family protein n=1 Tax=Serinibacter arcticus TaxID=1655435 RepID=UPI0013048E67|nr:acyltransferase [Serinibacter arcticus]